MASKRAAINETIQKDMEGRDLPKKPTERPTEGAQSVLDTEVKEYKGFTVRLTSGQYKAAKRYFEGQGIPLAVGVRSLILEKLKEERAI